ncbi:hypothetical protein F4777DRAFT_196042 [Nemania sp. FL0916]|nr:hypothetical protein F4777DRAFT_196042 [Nemania sp. FL0916]
MASSADANASHPDMADSPALSHAKLDSNHEPPKPSAGEVSRPSSALPIVSQLMQDKSRKSESGRNDRVPLTFLNLPVDVLRLIVNELVYTNDLVALALTHSALYELAIPNIYSRFDIVWPDTSIRVQNSKGVDALSYGLTTLCLPSRFAEATRRFRGAGGERSAVSRRLAHSDHAKYIRKFSIGDGPLEWTEEYLITKESGKMLGTLAAIAISKMVNLETFVWDMPTGVLSDVFMALSSLEDDKGQTKLEKVWVRWHDSTATTPTSSTASSPTTAFAPLNNPAPHPPPPGAIPNSIGNNAPANGDSTTPQPKLYSQSCVEYPTFSILPPLKSLTVLDIDDLSYLDEMSVLIGRSASCLRELQVGISKKAYNVHDFAQPWDGANLQQVDHEAKWPGESQIPTTRLGGVLGVLVGRVYDIRRQSNAKNQEKPALNHDIGASTDGQTLEQVTKAEQPQPSSKTNEDLSSVCSDRERLDGKLQLEKLALERVTLSIAVCSRAIDWSNMSSLTIFNCQHHDSLWKALKRQFQPTPPAHGSPEGELTRYHLSLKHLSTDQVSPALLNFVKEAIAPNTMQTIFLLDRQPSPKPSVTLEQVFKSIVKRHRNSLKKLLIDSSEKPATDTMITAVPGRWKHWAIKDEFLSYITSGRMPNLRELGMVLQYKDWHTFLQKLPRMADLRSLYIPHIVERQSKPVPAPKELALQIVDIISLRREVRLVYIGLRHKCFEIVEIEGGDGSSHGIHDDNGHSQFVDDLDHTDGNSEGDETTDDEQENGNDPFTDPDDEVAWEGADDDQSETGSSTAETAHKLPRLRLREILYYDDKVDLFRARHGKL